MVASSVCLWAAGIACLFAPTETAAVLGRPGADSLLVQLLGALYVASGSANWTARGSMMGGIYARPLSVANFFHFVVGAIVLVKEFAPAGSLNAAYVLVTAGYLAFAVVFALILYGRLERAP